MALSTTQSIWRSGGGDNTRTAYCGTGLMAAQFVLDPLAVNTTSVKVSSAANAPALVLPAGAVIFQIQVDAAVTGGTSPTVDMGFTLYGTTTTSPTSLLTAYGATVGEQMLFTSTAGTGTSFGKVMSATSLVTITGGATTGDAGTGGSFTGTIFYYVTDPLIGQQNV